jgi:hypothetical protein
MVARQGAKWLASFSSGSKPPARHQHGDLAKELIEEKRVSSRTCAVRECCPLRCGSMTSLPTQERLPGRHPSRPRRSPGLVTGPRLRVSEQECCGHPSIAKANKAGPTKILPFALKLSLQDRMRPPSRFTGTPRLCATGQGWLFQPSAGGVGCLQWQHAGASSHQLKLTILSINQNGRAIDIHIYINSAC